MIDIVFFRGGLIVFVACYDSKILQIPVVHCIYPSSRLNSLRAGFCEVESIHCCHIKQVDTQNETCTHADFMYKHSTAQ